MLVHWPAWRSLEHYVKRKKTKHLTLHGFRYAVSRLGGSYRLKVDPWLRHLGAEAIEGFVVTSKGYSVAFLWGQC